MQITAYIHPQRTAITPTGVGKHIIHMVSKLSQRETVHVKLLTANEELADGRIDSRSPLSHLPAVGHPLPRAVMEKLWLVTNYPKADRWTGDCDWVYCPAESYVPLRRPRLAVTIHASYFFENLPGIPSAKSGLWLRMLFQKIVDRADLVLTVSDFMKGRLVEIFRADPNRIAVVGNGVEEAYFQAIPGTSPLIQIRPEYQYVLVVGGLTSMKGAPAVIAVARALSTHGMHVVVAGHTNPAFRREADATPNLIDVGYQPAEILSRLMSNSVALMFLSRYESFGIPAVEAMAAGTPAVVARAGALGEVVGDAGIIVDPHEPEAIAHTLIELSRNPRIRADYIERGRRRARQFSWDECATRLLSAMGHAS